MEQTNQPNQKSYNLEPNVAGALAYLLAPFTGILFLVIEKENKFVRFHAMQSILFGIAAFAITIISNILAPLVSIASFVLWLFLMWKAYSNIEYELPVLGKIAREQVNKMSAPAK